MKDMFLKKTAALFLAALLLLVPAAALAQASVSVEANKTSIDAGDTVEVTVTVKGSAMAIATGSFTYDPAVLSYKESTGGASDGFLSMASAKKGGTDTLTARIVFTAIGAGKADIKVELSSVLGYDGKEQGAASASVSVTAAAPAPTPTPVPIDYAKNGVAAQNVKNAAESMYIWRTLENVTLPASYAEAELTYHGEKVAAATVADSDAPTLLYLSNASGSEGGYYIYNAAADTLYPYQTVSSTSKTYIILEPDGSVKLPDGFAETTLAIGEKTYTAWKMQDAQGEIYLLYARNSGGEVGYYVYNAADESLQRYAVMPARPVQPTLPPEPEATPAPVEPTPAQSAVPAPEKEGTIQVSSALFYAICGIAALLLLLVAAVLILRAVENSRSRRRAAARKAARDRAKQDISQ